MADTPDPHPANQQEGGVEQQGSWTAETGATRTDVGPVAGQPGELGVAGRGVIGTSIVAERLVLSYSDSTTQDVGSLPTGPPGRGVRRAEVTNCRWRVTCSDGVTEDAGDACTTSTVTPSPTTTTGLVPLPTAR